MNTIDKYRKIYLDNSEDLYFFGFSRWKRGYIKPFFYTTLKNKIYFCTSLKDALKKGLSNDSKIYIWGKKDFKDIEEYVNKNGIKLFRVEDGFIRSISLGSDLTKPYSLVVDSRGIYFDPTSESDLEYILNNYEFDEELINRAKKIREFILDKKISKYNIYSDTRVELKGLKENQQIILVPGQVEDDASIIYGADGMTNLELLKKVKKEHPDKYIIYKPHPDVLAGNRVGNVDRDEALKYCNIILTKVSLDSILEVANEVHTMTSLVGFEALLRGKKVYTYGMPFYAGWGLTIDSSKCKRRKRELKLLELVAATYILYPRYINPKTNKLCEIEELLNEVEKEKIRYNSNNLYRLYVNSRNFISRKLQFLLKVILGE